MTAEIASTGCNGCGLCTDLCPTVFEMNKKFYAEVLTKDVPLSKEKQAREAKKNCPVSAITLV